MPVESHLTTVPIGVAIRSQREGSRTTQEAFAKMIRMHQANYSTLERGKTNLAIKTLERVCRGLKISPGQQLKKIDM
jgi:transcriptional regulator with XRE-family HTH domain